MTPEGKVKAACKRELDRYPHYREMPVPSGFGKSGLDFTVCFFGRFLAIETKRDGKEPTERQQLRIREIEAAGGVAIAIIGVDEAKTVLRPLLVTLAGNHAASHTQSEAQDGSGAGDGATEEPVPVRQGDHSRRIYGAGFAARARRDSHAAPARVRRAGPDPKSVRVAGKPDTL